MGWKLDSIITAFRKPKKATARRKEVGAEVLVVDDSKEVVQPADVNVYDDGVVQCIARDVDNLLTDRVADACQRAVKQKTRLHLIINTYGGNPDAANAIIGILAHFQSQGNELRIIVRGVCQSAGMMVRATRTHARSTRVLRMRSRTVPGSRGPAWFAFTKVAWTVMSTLRRPLS